MNLLIELVPSKLWLCWEQEEYSLCIWSTIKMNSPCSVHSHTRNLLLPCAWSTIPSLFPLFFLNHDSFCVYWTYRGYCLLWIFSAFEQYYSPPVKHRLPRTPTPDPRVAEANNKKSKLAMSLSPCGPTSFLLKPFLYHQAARHHLRTSTAVSLAN